MRMIAGQTEGWLDYDVYLDGAQVNNAFEVDDEQGKVWIHSDDYPGYKVLSGVVELRKKVPQPKQQSQQYFDVPSDVLSGNRIMYGYEGKVRIRGINGRWIEGIGTTCWEDEPEYEYDYVNESVSKFKKSEYNFSAEQLNSIVEAARKLGLIS